MKKSLSILMSIIIGVSLLLSGCAGKSETPDTTQSTAEKIEIKFTTVQLPTQQMGIGLQRIKDLLDERLGDKVDVKIYPGAQLYSGAEEIEALSRGEIQFAYCIGGATETVSEILQLVKLPFLFPNVEIGYKVLEEGETGKRLFKPLNDVGIELIGILSSGRAALANNKHPLKLPADFKGLKMRAPGKMDSLIVTKLGAIAVTTPSEETYSAVQQGVVDGMTTPNTVFIARRYFEVQKYVTDGDNMSFQTGYLLANKAWWDNLQADIKKVLLDTIKEVEAQQRAEIEIESDQLFERMAEEGCIVHKLTPEEKAEWIKATESVYEEMEDIVGKELIELARKETAEFSKAAGIEYK